jgi:hypothetical protein
MDRELRERAALLEYLAALGAKPDQLERAVVVPLPDLAELVRWWSSLLPRLLRWRCGLQVNEAARVVMLGSARCFV